MLSFIYAILASVYSVPHHLLIPPCALPPAFCLQLVLGFIYAILASALCSLAAGCLVYVRSTHDEVRAAAAALLQEAGSKVSK